MQTQSSRVVLLLWANYLAVSGADPGAAADLHRLEKGASLALSATTAKGGSNVSRPSAGAEMQRWERFNFAKTEIRPDQINHLSLLELKHLRGIVFGRHGRVFGEKVIQDYLRSRPWYRPDRKFKTAMLNATERKNMDAIKAAESTRHRYVEPGDLRFYRNRFINNANLRKYTLAELRIMRAEIEALHGKKFDDEPWLREFFLQRYWYNPQSEYSPRSLSRIESKNIEILGAAEQSQRHLKLAPGTMKFFQKRFIKAQMLQGLGLHELRLLRNEAFALHGQRFRTQWIQKYFSGQAWYRPLPDFREPALSKVEQENVDLIVNHEARLHQELATKLVTPRLLKDLSVEDARKLRNEIYARRGKEFKDAELNRYFSSFAWYKPRQNFNEHMMNSIEKRNASKILAYEKHAEDLMSHVAA